MSEQGGGGPIGRRGILPPNLEGGVYANEFAAWYTAHEFTLDFAVKRQPRRLDPDDEDSPVEIVSRVVSRVRIPVTIAFDVIRSLNVQLTRYEQEFGEIRRPEESGGDKAGEDA